MAVNPDPRPGRWILPLVILAMMAFTYLFVSELPEAPPDTTLLSSPTPTTVLDTSETTVPGNAEGTVDDATRAYLDELDEINAALQVLDTEMITVNDGFDADPKQVEFSEPTPDGYDDWDYWTWFATITLFDQEGGRVTDVFEVRGLGSINTYPFTEIASHDLTGDGRADVIQLLDGFRAGDERSGE